MISAKYLFFHVKSSIRCPSGPTWSISQILRRFSFNRYSKFFEFLAMKRVSGLATVGILILRGLRVFCGSGLIDLTVRTLAASIMLFVSLLMRDLLIVMVFCFLTEARCLFVVARVVLLLVGFIFVHAGYTILFRGDMRV